MTDLESKFGRTVVTQCILVAQSCPTLYDPMDYSLPGSSVHGILQARILEWVAIPFSIYNPVVQWKPMRFFRFEKHKDNQTFLASIICTLKTWCDTHQNSKLVCIIPGTNHKDLVKTPGGRGKVGIVKGEGEECRSEELALCSWNSVIINLKHKYPGLWTS